MSTPPPTFLEFHRYNPKTELEHDLYVRYSKLIIALTEIGLEPKAIELAREYLNICDLKWFILPEKTLLHFYLTRFKLGLDLLTQEEFQKEILDKLEPQ